MRLAVPIVLILCAFAAAIIWHGPLLAWFTGRPLGASSSAAGAGETADTIPAGPFTIQLASQPAQLSSGLNQLTIRVRDGGAALAGAQVTVQAVMAASGAMQEMRAMSTFRDSGQGAYHGELALPMAGTWQLHLTVRTSDGRSGEARVQVATGQAIRLSAVRPAKGIAYYTCSMHPAVRAQIPGKCPICGMDLIPVTTVEVQSGVVFADAQRRQLIGVTTDTARTVDTVLEIRAAGVVAYAETGLRDVTLRFPVWIGEVFANTLGAEVHQGQPLFTISSPDLLTAENDYIQSQRQAHPDLELTQATRSRLELWGLSSSQLVELRREQVPQRYATILAPGDGVIIEKNILPGGALAPGQVAVRLADASQVWIEAAIYEYEEGAISTGQPVEVTLTAFPGERWNGNISFIYPFLDDQTRTTRVRIPVANADHRLKPGMYASAELRIPLGPRLVVPADAVIHAGETELVFLDLGDGRFKPQHVTTGLETRDGEEIRSGLSAGDVVVTKAAFLLAAESRLKSGAASW